MRLFVALDPPESVRDALMPVQDGLGLGRDVPEAYFHLTLAFLGDQPVSLAEGLHDCLMAVRAPEVRVAVHGVELFGGRSPSAAVALIERVPELIALQEKVTQAARMVGMDVPRRRFKPHITLTRFPRRLPDFAETRIGAWLAQYGDLRIAACDARQFSLYRSDLHADGPIYEPLASYPLIG